MNSKQLKQAKDVIAHHYGMQNNYVAAWQLINTLLPYLLLFYLAAESLQYSLGLSLVFILLLSLFNLRMFVLMHDCGHFSLFKSIRLNKFFGFTLGVLCGMPQYVWSKHHSYHHATNGNWQKFRGALGILSTDEFARLSPRDQKIYQFSRHISNAPFGGFVYFIFNPRYTWLKGSIQLIIFYLKLKIQKPSYSFRKIVAQFKTPYWKNFTEYRHMFWNNVVLLSLWVIMIELFGAMAFFTVYILSLSLAGAAGLILFTIQHNFEGSYASDDDHWDYYRAVLDGTSYLKLPKLLNWFTADIAFHHIHHLSSRIPNYQLAKCHRENRHLFKKVQRIKFIEFPAAMRCILWYRSTQKIISIQQFRQQGLQGIK